MLCILFFFLHCEFYFSQLIFLTSSCYFARLSTLIHMHAHVPMYIHTYIVAFFFRFWSDYIPYHCFASFLWLLLQAFGVLIVFFHRACVRVGVYVYQTSKTTKFKYLYIFICWISLASNALMGFVVVFVL